MSRLHSGKKGQSGSVKPLLAPVPNWVTYKDKEVESLVVKLAKQGNSSAAIGNILRDSYGVPDVKKITGMSITQIMEKNKLSPDVPEDIQLLLKRAIRAKKHLDKNKKDMVTKRGLHLMESKIRRLAKYYKSSGKLPGNWKYELIG
jgi:small subunit ribosomal protein S15